MTKSLKIAAIGKAGSGKTQILKLIMEFLRTKGMICGFDMLEEHQLLVIYNPEDLRKQ